MSDRPKISSYLLTLLLFVILEVVCFLMIGGKSVFQNLRISGAVMHFQGKIAKAGTDIKYYFHLKDVNEQLAQENSRLLNILEKYKTQMDTARLDSLYYKQLSDSSDFSYIPAKIVGNSTNNLHNFIIIDKGRKNGINKDMGVISPNGVVGVISAVSENYAYVISLLNVNQSVSAKIAKCGAFGPLIWNGRSPDYAILTEIPQHIKIQVGDSILTSGFSSLFPADIPLGTIRKSKIVMGTHHEIQVKLFQDFKTLRYVNVVVNNHKSELDTISVPKMFEDEK